MKRPRSRFAVEPLEGRQLLAGNLDGMYPPIDATPDTTVFVRFQATDPASDQSGQLAALKASVVTAYPDGPELIALGPGVTPASAIARLSADPGVLYASPNGTIQADALAPDDANLPDDPGLAQDWAVSNPNGVDIDLPQAWGVTLGSRSTIIAVIDTGIDLNNPDFAGKIWTNPSDDAFSGFPGDVHGWNFVDNNADVQDTSDDGHGTHVSAIIAAIGNNDYGIAGVDQNAQIMPLKFLDDSGNGTIANAVAAVYYAVNKGANVINASWGGEGYSAPLQDAIAYANAHNVVFVTAAGNEGTDNDTDPSYPASYEAPNELSVAAVDSNGNLPSFSNFGPSTVNLGAPGDNIVSDVPTSVDPSGLESLSGTSMSTAYVSGVAALVSGLNPSFTAAQVVQRLDSTVKPLPSLRGQTISGGMVDAYNAVTDNGTVTIQAPVPVAGLPSFAPGQATDAQIHALILASDEFFADEGGTASGFITGLYDDLLDRQPDPAGLAQWVGTYNSGTVTRYDIAYAIATSPEARLTEVAQWYQQDLGWTTSIAALKENSGVAFWANILVQGAGDNTVQAAIMSFPEYLDDHGNAPDSIVQGYYSDILDRPADPAGLSYWAGLLESGLPANSVLRMIQGAPEAMVAKVSNWFIQDLGRPETVAQLKDDPGVQALGGELGNF